MAMLLWQGLLRDGESIPEAQVTAYVTQSFRGMNEACLKLLIKAAAVYVR